MKFTNKYIKISIICLLSFLSLVVIGYMAIQLPVVQNYVKDKLLKSLSKNYQAEWSIGSIEVSFFDAIKAKDILFLDQSNDTLLKADLLDMDISFFSLFKKEIVLEDIHLVNPIVKITSNDESYNFDFLLNESTSNNKPPEFVSDKSNNWNVSLSKFIISNPSISFKDLNNDIKVSKGELELNIKTFDIDNEFIDVTSFEISDVFINVINNSVNTNNSNKNDSTIIIPDLGWAIDIGLLSLKNSDAIYSSDNNRLQANEINLEVAEFLYVDDRIEFNVVDANTVVGRSELTSFSSHVEVINNTIHLNNLKLKSANDFLDIDELKYNFGNQWLDLLKIKSEISFFTLNEFKHFLPANIKLIKNQDLKINASNLNLTPKTIVSKNLFLKYGKSLTTKGFINVSNYKDSKNIKTNTVVESFDLKLQDLKKIFPSLQLSDSLFVFDRINLSGEIIGGVKRVDVQNLSLKLGDFFYGNLDGRVENIFDTKNLFFNLNVNESKTNLEKANLINSNSLSIDSLGLVSFSGQLTGTVADVKFDGDFNSDLGKIKAQLEIGNLDQIESIKYNGDVKFENFDLGILLNNSSIGVLNINTYIAGSGLKLGSVNSKIKGEIESFVFNDYNYKNISLNASINNTHIDGQLLIDDPNAKLSYSGLIDLNDEKSILNFRSDIEKLDFKKLGLFNKYLTVSGKIASDFSLPLSSNEKGSIKFSDVLMYNQVDSFYFDSLNFNDAKTSDSTFVSIDSDFLELDLTGKFGIRDLSLAIESLVNNYYSIYNPTADFKSKSLSVNGNLATLAPISVIANQKNLSAKNVSIAFDSYFKNSNLEGEIIFDSLTYNNNFTAKARLQFFNEDKDLFINWRSEDNNISNLSIQYVTLENVLNRGLLTSSLIAMDGDEYPMIKLSSELKTQKDQFVFSLLDSVVFNKKDWIVNKSNNSIFTDKGIYIDNLNFSTENENLELSTIDNEPNSFQFRFVDFDIGQFVPLVMSDPISVKGNLNGYVNMHDVLSNFYFITNVTIDDIRYDSTEIKRISITANHDPILSEVKSQIKLNGPSNDLEGNILYSIDTKDIVGKLELAKLELKLLDPFLAEIISNSNGYLKGEVDILGNIKSPEILGRVDLENISTTVVPNNTLYRIEKHSINFNKRSIDLGRVKIYDENNNEATLFGKIYHRKLSDVLLDLRLYSSKFRFLSTSYNDNPVFNGQMILRSNMSITGPPKLLNVNVSATTLDGTDITLSPFSSTNSIIKESFIRYGNPELEDAVDKYLLQIARKYPFKVNIELESNEIAKLNFIIDPISGDKISGVGSGNLIIKLNPDGKQEIFGKYTIENGTYNFSYGDFVRKKFVINNGGIINFNGNPLEAKLDVEAIYNVNTTTYELIQNDFSFDESELAASKRRSNVQVFLALKGSLDAPLINLDIKVPDLESSNLLSSIERKLTELRADPNLLNNQVFGLLLFDSFLLPNSTSISFNNFGNNLALSSISNLISNQLNSLAKNTIKGVDLSVNVNSYDTEYAIDAQSRNITELGLKVSKQLFNDRLRVTAGGNVDLQTDESTGTYSSFIGDFVLEYNLTEDGRYRIRVFSKSNFDGLLDENSNKNGVGLFFNKSFDDKSDAKR